MDGRRSIELSEHANFWRAGFFAMGSPCEVLSEAVSESEARALAGAVAAEAWRIEDRYSRYIAGNIIDRINTASGRPVALDDETARLIEFAIELYALSDGRFDVTSGVLRRVWTFDGSDRVPAETDVIDVMRYVGWHRVRYEDRTLQMPEGMEIDLGGIGKEYAVDKAVERLRGTSDTGCLVNFGGDLAVTGPPTRQAAWHVGREALQGGPGKAAGVVRLQFGALATSGDTRRYLFRDGIRYSHILDPTTGWPIAHAPASVTVAADTCVQAGMLCTLAMLEGEGAEAMLDAAGADYWCTRL